MGLQRVFRIDIAARALQRPSRSMERPQAPKPRGNSPLGVVCPMKAPAAGDRSALAFLITLTVLIALFTSRGTGFQLPSGKSRP